LTTAAGITIQHIKTGFPDYYRKACQLVEKVISAKWSACQSGMKDWIMGEGKLLFSFPQAPIFSAF